MREELERGIIYFPKLYIGYFAVVTANVFPVFKNILLFTHSSCIMLEYRIAMY